MTSTPLEDKKKIIDELISSKQLPKTITPDFVSAVNELLSGLDSVEVDPEHIEREMVSWGLLLLEISKEDECTYR